MTTRIVFNNEQKLNPIIGDELHEKWRIWLTDNYCEGCSRGYFFCRWLIETADGAEALKHINNMPRQLWLDFGNKPPWTVVEGAEDDGATDGDGGSS